MPWSSGGCKISPRKMACGRHENFQSNGKTPGAEAAVWHPSVRQPSLHARWRKPSPNNHYWSFRLLSGPIKSLMQFVATGFRLFCVCTSHRLSHNQCVSDVPHDLSLPITCIPTRPPMAMMMTMTIRTSTSSTIVAILTDLNPHHLLLHRPPQHRPAVLCPAWPI